jgi:hypothetical protein
MDTSTQVDRISGEDRTIYSATMAVINGMIDSKSIEHKNKSISDLTDEVAAAITREPEEIKPFISHFCRSLEKDAIAYVAPGRHGGVRIGARPSKTTKAKVMSQAMETDNTTVIDMITEDMITEEMN